MRVSASWRGMPNEAAKMFVAIIPGQMQFTRTFSCASCEAAALVMCTTPALAIE